MNTIADIKTHGGHLLKLEHQSDITLTKMQFNVFLPPTYSPTSEGQTPLLLYLSGLTCTPQNASEKSGIFYFAAKHGLAVLLPDTSPRGAQIDGEDKDWDLGTGAGFYLNATRDPWNKNYHMYSYILQDLLPLIKTQFKGFDKDRISILGHSMGGLGALVLYLRNPEIFKSCSAFAPICNPSVVPWGQKAFSNYLGESEKDKENWSQYDPCELIKRSKVDKSVPILIHVGNSDTFFDQLQPHALIEASRDTSIEIKLNLVDGYDHSYYFISSFMESHIDFHLQYLK